ncbi:hypothetical protein BC829DRAFT_385225 [Chytridium lagenaria]|nr:hypothetical protein BC829DRAFT_385225 [Chytridium lagenaria]
MAVPIPIAEQCRELSSIFPTYIPESEGSCCTSETASRYITCDDTATNIIQILGGTRIPGARIPTAGRLRSLESINFAGIPLEGGLSNMGELFPLLRLLDLSSTQVVGVIPTSFTALRNLEYLSTTITIPPSSSTTSPSISVITSSTVSITPSTTSTSVATTSTSTKILSEPVIIALSITIPFILLVLIVATVLRMRRQKTVHEKIEYGSSPIEPPHLVARTDKETGFPALPQGYVPNVENAARRKQTERLPTARNVRDGIDPDDVEEGGVEEEVEECEPVMEEARSRGGR